MTTVIRPLARSSSVFKRSLGARLVLQKSFLRSVGSSYGVGYTPVDIGRRWNSSASSTLPAAQGGNPALEAPKSGSTSQPIGQIEPRLQMTFTCTADACGHRSTHEFTKRAYTKGIVLVQCPSCKNRHLIADHLGWFKESTEDGKHRTVEDLLRAKGEIIKKGRVNFDGDIEYDGEQGK